jgi:uncharacterized protein (TIGR03083 family)
MMAFQRCGAPWRSEPRTVEGETVGNGSKEPVVDVLDEAWTAIGQLGDVLEASEWDLPSECPGWTVRDVLSHMVGTERSLLGETAPAPVSTPPHVHNAVGARNEGWVASLRTHTGPEVLADFRDVTARRLEQLRSWPSSRFDELGPSPVGEVPYREFMRVRVMDCWVHEQDIRVATARPGHRHGPAATLAIDRLASAMPFIVGKRAGAPDGSSVRFELTGNEPRRLDVVVRGGRAAIDDASEGEPTAELRMDLEVFWRLGCGRVSGEAARGAGLVELRGETELAERVVDSMAFMI